MYDTKSNQTVYGTTQKNRGSKVILDTEHKIVLRVVILLIRS